MVPPPNPFYFFIFVINVKSLMMGGGFWTERAAMHLKAHWPSLLEAARRGNLEAARQGREQDSAGALADYFYGRCLRRRKWISSKPWRCCAARTS